MTFDQVCYIVLPIAVGVLVFIFVLLRFWHDKTLTTGGIILAVLAIVLVFGPRVLGFDVTTSGAKVTLDKFNRATDANIEAASNALGAINSIKIRLDAIETSIKTMPSPTINTLPNGNWQWDFGSAKGDEISPKNWCKTVPSLCELDGKPKVIPQGKQLPWSEILRSQDEMKTLDFRVKGLQDSIDKLEAVKNFAPN